MNHTRRSGCRALLSIFLLALPAAAQEAESPSGQFIERIEVRLVDVDVVVTDRQGNPIIGLKPEDFKLYEDGREVAITYFTPVVEGYLAAAPAPAGEAPAAVEPADAVAPPAAPRSRAPLTWALFIDNTRLRPGPRNDALRRLRSFLEGNLRPGDRAIIGAFDGRQFRVRRALTTDHRALLRDLEEIQEERFDQLTAEEMAIRSEMQLVQDPLTEGQHILSALDLYVEKQAESARHAIGALETFLDVLAGQEGRLAMVYVGAGFQVLPGMGLTEQFRRRFPTLATLPGAPRPEDHQLELQPRLANLYARVSADRTAFYAIDVADRNSIVGPEDPGDNLMDTSAVGDAGVPQEEATVRELAQRTGGQYFRRNPELDKQLSAVAQDLGYYYSLGYVPTGPPQEHRKLRVEVVVPGARVRHRQAVRERTPEEQAGAAVVTALFSGPGANPLGVTVETDTAERAPKGRGSVVPTRVLVPLRGLALLPEGQAHRGELTLHFAMAQPNGTVWRLDERQLPLSIPDADIEAALAQHITYNIGVPVVADNVNLAVAVQDRVSGLRSVVTVPITGRKRR